MPRKNKKPDEAAPNSKVGGFAFFASLISLVVVLVVHTLTLLRFWPAESFRSLGIAIVTFTLGALFAKHKIKGWPATYIHETKHAVFSGLVGNKAKAKVVGEESGHFEYSYTKDTAGYNALIALAPYWLPLFSVPMAGLVVLVGIEQHVVRVGLVSLAYGIDVMTGAADVAPWQTDLTQIRGGYRVGKMFVILAQAVVITIFLAWVLGDVQGLLLLAKSWWMIPRGIVG